MRDPEGFWGAAAEDIYWERRWDRVLDDSRKPFYRWFVGAALNTCYNALDLHIDRGRGKQRALVYDSPVTNTTRTFTYRELRDEVARCGGALRAHGIRKGDRVIIYMPMVPEAVIAMLACARIGAIHSVVFGGFAAKELATRIDDAKPRLLISASCGIEAGQVVPYKPLLDRAIELARHKVERCIILQRSQERGSMVAGRDLGWGAAGRVRARRGDGSALHPLYVGNHRRAQRRRTRQRWSRRRPQVVYGQCLWPRRRRGVLDRLGHRLGRRPLVHRVRAAPQGLHDRPLRGQARRDAGPRRLLARLRPARCQRPLHGPHR